MLTRITWKTYIIFICTLFTGILWVIFLLPETRGASLEELDMIFHSRTGERDVERMNNIARDLGLVEKARVGDDKARLSEKPSHNVEGDGSQKPTQPVHVETTV